MRYNRSRLIFIFTIPLILNSVLIGSDIYVDKNNPQANDSNQGTEALPLQSIDRAMAVVQPGDHVYIKGGTNTTDPDAIYDRSGKHGLPIQTPGTAVNAIVIEAYPGHTVVLEGDESNYAISLDYASYHEIRGFTFLHFARAGWSWGNKFDILIEDCEFGYCPTYGFRIHNITNFTMRDVYVHHCFEAGIFIGDSTDVFLERVKSSYNGDEGGTSGDGDGIDANYVQNFVCIDCIAIGNSEDGFALTSDGVLINCLAQDHAGCNLKLWRREGDSYAPKKMDVINCIFHRAGQAGIRVHEGAELHLYNSVVHNNGEFGISFGTPSTAVAPVYSTIANTIIAENGHTAPGYHGIYVSSTTMNIVDADHNLYYNNYVATGGLHSNTNAVVGQDPLFFGPASGMFQLRDGSPAIDTGTTIAEVESYFSMYSSYFTQGCAEDLDGDCRPSGVAWDIGSDERVTVSGNTPPTFTIVPSPPPINEGETLTLQFEASDPQGDALVFFLSGGDVVDGMEIDSATGEFSFTPTYDRGGDTSSPQQAYDVIVSVTDELFAEPADQTTVHIVVNNVNRAPTYDGLSLYTLVEGRLWMYGLAFSEMDGDTINYSALNLPSGMTVGDANGIVLWTPTEEQVGQHTVQITASDGADATIENITFEVLPIRPYVAPTDETMIFYVDDVNGNDANDGQSEETAWKTIHKAGSTLQAGQMVLIRSGTYNEEVTPNSGTSGNPIIFKGYPGESPVMDGAGLSSPEAFRGGAHLVYDGLIFRNYEETIHCGWTEGDFVVVNCIIENANLYGIYAFTGDKLRVENVTFNNIGDRGIYGGGTNIHLYNVIIDTVGDHGISLSSSSVDNLTIVNSRISHAPHYGIVLQGKSVFIHKTYIHDNGQLGIDLAAKYNFFIDSSVWNTSLFGTVAVNLRFRSNMKSKSWVFNSIVTESASRGIEVGSSAWVYMRDTIVSNNVVQDFYISNEGILINGSSFPPDPTNTPPVITAIGEKGTNEKVLLSFSVLADDSDGDMLTYSAINLPQGANFEPTTQMFTWIPANDQNGIYYVGFMVSDSNAIVTETVKITVNDVANQAPVLTPISDQNVYQSDLLSFSVVATDPDGNPLIYSATSLPNGANFTNQLFSWVPTADQVGSYSVIFTVSDSELTDSEKINILVIGGTIQRTLSFSSSSGGSITVPGEGDFQYSHGTFVAIRATPLSNYYFVNWTGTAVDAGKVTNPNAADTTVTADADYTLQAHFDQQDGAAPTLTNLSPSADDIQVPLNNLIILHVTDTGIGVDADTVTITLDGDTIYTGDTTYYTSSTGHCFRAGTPADFTYVYQSSQNFDFDQILTVTVNAADLGAMAMTEQSYSFTTEMRSFGQNKQVDSTIEGLDKAGASTTQDSSGNIWAVWHIGPVGNRDIYIAKLASGADDFDASVPLVSHSADQSNPAIAVGTDDRLYVVWQDNRPADDNLQGEWDIYISSSLDGFTWTVETRVNDPNEGNQTHPTVIVDSQSPNYAHVVWQDDRAGNQDICLASSNDGFAIKTVSQITNDPLDQTEPTIAVDSSNTVYVLWTDARNPANGLDIYGAASNAGPWTNVPIVSEAFDQSSPALGVESVGSMLHMVWVDQTSGDSGIYYASSNGLPGSSLAGSNIVDDYAKGEGQFSPAIAVTGSTGNGLKVFTCWHDERDVSGSTGDTDIWYVRANAGSGTNVFIGDGSTNSNQTEPAMGIDPNGHPYILWTDDRGVKTEIYYAAGTYLNPIILASEQVTPTSLDVTVGTDPGAIADEDDFSVVLLAGTCPYNLNIIITEIENPPEFALQNILNGCDFGPSGLVFNVPVTITIPYAVTGTASTPTAYWYNSRTGALSQEGITNVEIIEPTSSLHALRFDSTHLTPFFVIQRTATGGGGGGGGGCALSSSKDESIFEYFLPYGILAIVMRALRWRDRRGQKNSPKTSSS